jgi:hypothetical protein
LPGSLDFVVWGIAVFVVLALFGYYLGLNKVGLYYHSFSAVRLLALLCGLAGWFDQILSSRVEI